VIQSRAAGKEKSLAVGAHRKPTGGRCSVGAHFFRAPARPHHPTKNFQTCRNPGRHRGRPSKKQRRGSAYRKPAGGRCSVGAHISRAPARPHHPTKNFQTRRNPGRHGGHPSRSPTRSGSLIENLLESDALSAHTFSARSAGPSIDKKPASTLKSRMTRRSSLQILLAAVSQYASTAAWIPQTAEIRSITIRTRFSTGRSLCS
jgi:hypothetical protein